MSMKLEQLTAQIVAVLRGHGYELADEIRFTAIPKDDTAVTCDGKTLRINTLAECKLININIDLKSKD